MLLVVGVTPKVVAQIVIQVFTVLVQVVTVLVLATIVQADIRVV